MRAIGWVALATFLAGIALASAACHTPEPNPGGGGPTDAPAGPKVVTHKPLETVQTSLEVALPATGEIYFGAVAAAAGAIHAGSDAILDDRPAAVAEADRPKYEGMVAQLKERALQLKAAAEAKQAISTRRGAGRITASCVRCHALFGAPTAGAEGAAAPADGAAAPADSRPEPPSEGGATTTPSGAPSDG